MTNFKRGPMMAPIPHTSDEHPQMLSFTITTVITSSFVAQTEEFENNPFHQSRANPRDIYPSVYPDSQYHNQKLSALPLKFLLYPHPIHHLPIFPPCLNNNNSCKIIPIPIPTMRTQHTNIFTIHPTPSRRQT